MKEFNPRCERHYPLITVKAVEPGCTTEFQIENAQTGEITRITTTENAEEDEAALLDAVRAAVLAAWEDYQTQPHAVGTVATE